MRIFVIVLSSILLLGCQMNSSSAQLSAGAQAVQVVYQDNFNAKGCQFLGEISASSIQKNTEVARQNAMVKLKNQTAELGGNKAVIQHSENVGTMTGGYLVPLQASRDVSLSGAAYRCP